MGITELTVDMAAQRQNANGERPREFGDAMELIVSNNCLKRITINW